MLSRSKPLRELGPGENRFLQSKNLTCIALCEGEYIVFEKWASSRAVFVKLERSKHLESSVQIFDQYLMKELFGKCFDH